MATIKTTLIVLLVALAACRSPQPATVKVVGLWPEQPALCYQPFDTWSGGNSYIWPVLDAQPTLRWEAFPRSADIAADTNNVLSQITAVSYDLRIWRNEGEFPVELVYARAALPAPAHRVEQPLMRGGRYFWSVRACFTVHGQIRVTDWSRLESPFAWGIPKQPASFHYPDARYYQFRVR